MQLSWFIAGASLAFVHAYENPRKELFPDPYPRYLDAHRLYGNVGFALIVCFQMLTGR